MSAQHRDSADGNASSDSTRIARSGSCSKELIQVDLEYREPYDFNKMLTFFASRVIVGIEKTDEQSYSRVVRIQTADDTVVTGWIRVSDTAENSTLSLTASRSLASVLPNVIARVRRQFDLDCDPAAIADGLASMSKTGIAPPSMGLRLPGCFDTFETICRAVIGQQVSVTAANSMAARIASAYGKPVDTGIEGLSYAWLTPQELLKMDDLESAFGTLGVIKNRTHAIESIAKLLVSGELVLDDTVPFEEQIDTLLSVKGIGPWTANYIAMRVLGYPDAFLESDVGVAHALPNLSPKERLALAEQWRPWRSYAVIALWDSLG